MRNTAQTKNRETREIIISELKGDKKVGVEIRSIGFVQMTHTVVPTSRDRLQTGTKHSD